MIHLLLHFFNNAYMLENTQGRHLNMSVYHIIELVSNWCHSKLYDYSEKTVIKQYCF